MSFDLFFVGPNLDDINEELGGGQKWIRNVVHRHAFVCLEREDGYITPELVKKIAVGLSRSTSDEPDVKKVREIFERAAKKGFAAQVSW